MSRINIIGSGIIGMLSAHELIKEGHEINLFDKGEAGHESTWAGGGIISPLFPWRYHDSISKLSLLSQSLYPHLISDIQTHFNHDPDYLNSGMLLVDCPDFDKAKNWANQFEVDLDFLNTAETHSQFDFLNKSFKNSAWLPQIHQIRNPRLVKLTKQSLVEQGATFYEQTEITKVSLSGQQISAIHTNDKSFEADMTIICSGAWTGDLIKKLLPKSEEHIPINPVHGQMLLLKNKEPLFKPIVLHQGRYIIPRKDGHVLIGSTTELQGYKKQTTIPVKEKLLEYAQHVIPKLKKASVEKHWSGLRPGSIQGIPTISRHPEINNLYINSGHYRNGLVTAPASALLIKQLICNQTPCLDPQLYEFKNDGSVS